MGQKASRTVIHLLMTEIDEADSCVREGLTKKCITSSINTERIYAIISQPSDNCLLD